MLFLNGLESSVFATKITPQPNYLTRQMLGFLGLYKDQNTVFIILPDPINSCPMDLRHRGHSFPLPQCKYNLHKNSFFHGVCSNMCSYWRFVCNLVIVWFTCFFLWCLRLSSTNKCLLTYLLNHAEVVENTDSDIWLELAKQKCNKFSTTTSYKSELHIVQIYKIR